MSATKTCSKCGLSKPLDDFKTDVRKPDGKASSCRKCNAPVGTLTQAIPTVGLANNVDVWATRISRQWHAGVESVMATGRLLISAKQALKHGQWGEVLAKLPFGERHAQMLMAIASDERLSNPKRLALLPPSWGTIYDISRLDDEQLERAFNEQIIRPDMERQDIERIRPLSPRAPRIARPMSDAEVLGSDGGVEGHAYQPKGQGLPAASEASSASERGGQTHPPGVGVEPDPSETIMPGGGLAIAHRRDESDKDPREFFPTPPWATRALVERVLRHLRRDAQCKLQKAWEPACGEGHMAEPLKEYFRSVFASDKYKYDYAASRFDFLTFDQPIATDWIITNPPFRPSTEFVLKALKLSGYGVAMFVRLAWIEGVNRYEDLLKDHPPSLLSIFTERVPLHKGRWLPDGSTFTAYAWLVWIKGMPPQPPFWIPPGCKKQLCKPSDVARFGAMAGEDDEEEQEVA